MHRQRVKILQNMPIFGGIRENILEYILETAEIVSVSAGQYFFHENDTETSMFVLEQGKVSVTRAWKGREYLLTELHTGDCFGEMSLIDPGPRTASVAALEECSAIKLLNTNILRIYQKDLEQFTMIQMNMGREVSRRLRKMDEDLFQTRIEAQTIQERPRQ
ncbi:cyclic nucleotide-binding protein [candidate division KSB3 bacterium]|uniref:Cyclic nucleotide-binding protein n=1 Tax=candidate division KSB3 bacterium TaxID=2044937 RepID=A0A2G6KHJ0_9BACT|nr:MAG: cyclic nucleotide-binding protein [candidate division KSB3 bacterium]